MPNYTAYPARWGHLKILERYRSPIMKTNSITGETYMADSHGPWMWRMLCDCGYEFEIYEDNFMGRRAMRYCGEPTCAYAPGKHTPKPKRRERGMAFTIYIHQEHIDYLDKCCVANDMSLSRAIETLIDKARADELIDSTE